MKLETLLGSLKTQHLHWHPSRGNAGDGMIQAGLFALCKRLGLKLEVVDYPREQTGQHILLMGAGGFCKGTWHMVDPVRFYSTRFKHVTVLPATFEPSFAPVAKLLRELPPNVTIFCRERTSYDAALKLVPRKENIFLEHDLAFQIDVSPWKKEGKGEVNCFRTDNESRLWRVPKPNFDISNMGREYHHTLLLLDLLANFETINTDRLHVTIAGALLGKKVRVFDNSYHKNRSMYEYSLRDQYPNVILGKPGELKALVRTSDKEFIHYNVARTLLRLPKGEVLRRAYKKRRQSNEQGLPL